MVTCYNWRSKNICTTVGSLWSRLSCCAWCPTHRHDKRSIIISTWRAVRIESEAACVRLPRVVFVIEFHSSVYFRTRERVTLSPGHPFSSPISENVSLLTQWTGDWAGLCLPWCDRQWYIQAAFKTSLLGVYSSQASIFYELWQSWDDFIMKSVQF